MGSAQARSAPTCDERDSQFYGRTKDRASEELRDHSHSYQTNKHSSSVYVPSPLSDLRGKPKGTTTPGGDRCFRICIQFEYF